MALASYLTNVGIAALTKLLATSSTVNFVAAELGNGVCTGEEACKARTSLVSKVADASYVGVSRDGNDAVVSVQYSNAGLGAGFFVNEIGLYIEDPDGGDPVLYCYATFGDTPDWIGPATMATYLRTYEIVTVIASTADVTITISPEETVLWGDLQPLLDAKVGVSDIVDSLSSDSATKPLSAKQGKVISDSLVPLRLGATDTERLNDINLDSYTSTGIYYLGTGLANAPGGTNNSMLVVLGGRGDSVRQLLYLQDVEYMRELQGEEWGAWRRRNAHRVETGIINVTVPANSVVSGSYTYDTPFTNAEGVPNVIIAPLIYVDPGYVTAATMTSYQSGFAYRVTNNHSAAYTLPLMWVASTRNQTAAEAEIIETKSLINTLNPGANVTIIGGGFVKVGKLVSICVQIRTTAAIAHSAPLLTGLDAPMLSNQNIRAGIAIEGQNDITAYAGRLYNSNLYSSAESLPAGLYNVSGTYVSI